MKSTLLKLTERETKDIKEIYGLWNFCFENSLNWIFVWVGLDNIERTSKLTFFNYGDAALP